MKVKKIMTRDVGFCHSNDKLIKAIEIMWQYDCGAVPVVDETSKVVGIITDRDICIATSNKNRPSSEIYIVDVINGSIHTCHAKDDIKGVLKTMGRNQIKRLPVVKKSGELAGIISVTDILLSVTQKALRRKVVRTIEAIGKQSQVGIIQTYRISSVL